MQLELCEGVQVHRLKNLNLPQNPLIGEGVNKVCYTQTSRLTFYVTYYTDYYVIRRILNP